MRAVVCWTLGVALTTLTAAPGGQKKEQLPKDTLDRLAAVQKEYAKRGARSDVYDHDGKTWVVFYFPREVTDKELVGLPEPPVPCNFNLHLCRVTDAGVKELKGIKTLKALDLASTQVTDAGLKDVAGIPGLVFLTLSSTKVTDAGLKELKGLENLTDLSLAFDAGVTDAGVKELLAFKKLKVVNLRETGVTPAGLKVLKDHKTLDVLKLGGPAVTDAWVNDLKALTNLGALGFENHKLTEAGVAELRTALPRAFIVK